MHRSLVSSPSSLLNINRIIVRNVAAKQLVPSLTVLPTRILKNHFTTNSKEHAIAFYKRRRFSTFTRSYQRQSNNQTPLKDELRQKITKASLLSQANSSLSRMLIHLKWPLSRNTSTTSSWDITSAFISWLVMGNILWIILGTTTFGLTLMYSLHYLDSLVGKFSDGEETTEKANETKSKKANNVMGYLVGGIISFGLGVDLNFEKGSSLPELKDGKLRFKNVGIVSKDDSNKNVKFKGTVEAMDITLSFNKWYEGNGLIYDLELYGLNGKLYKLKTPSPTVVNPTTKSYRFNENIHYQYDLDHNVEEITGGSSSIIDNNYTFDHVKIHDSYLEIYEEQSSTPIKVNIFNCDLPKLRGDKLVLDFFNANNASGAINDAMFTLHKRQNLDPENKNQDKLIRFKLDAIDLGEINKYDPNLKFNWIINGKAEIIADITLPDEQDDLSESITEVLTKMFSNMFQTVDTSQTSEDSLLKDAISAIYHTFRKPEEAVKPTENSYVIVNVKMKLYDLKASLPQVLPRTNDGIPFISLSDLRSLISFINTENVPITIKSTVIEKITDLSNIEHLGQTKMFDYIMGDAYEEFTNLVRDDARRIISEKSWSNSIATQLLLLGLGAMV